MPYNIDVREPNIFARYFADIEASTSEFQEAILPLLNSDWEKNGELLILKIQPFADERENNAYRECVEATKDYINSRDFMAPNKYETTFYFYGALQYNSESKALKNLNQSLDQLIQNIPEKSTAWSESFKNLWSQTASTLFGAFDFAKEHPLSTITALLYGQTILASALFPANFELSNINGINGFKMYGEKESDYCGWSVSSAGDVNGDGYADAIIGAYRADPGGKSSAGASYVVFGKAGGFESYLNLSSLDGSNGFRINGEKAGDWSGRFVSSAGDVNGDGYDDLVIGAPQADPDGKILAGRSYVVFGKASNWTSAIDLTDLDGSNGFKINGDTAYDWSGYSVSSAGDFNGDGYDDVIIGTYQQNYGIPSHSNTTYVIFGKANGWTSAFNLSALDGINGFKIIGELPDEWTGVSVSSAGDINHDGYGDLIIGAPWVDTNGRTDIGVSYIVYGKPSNYNSSFMLSDLDGNNGFGIDGAISGGISGRSVSAAGDVNGDGYDDVIIGAPGGIGESYVVFGKAEGYTDFLELLILDGINGFKIKGENLNDNSGISVSSAGDVNGDGYADLIIGAHAADPDGREFAGISYVIFGKANGWTGTFNLSSLDGINGFKINGEISYDASGQSVSSAGDVNNDGYADIIVSAYRATAIDQEFAGVNYIIFGNNAAPELTTSSSEPISYTESSPAIIIDSTIVVFDADHVNLARAIISIASNFHFDQDKLNFTDQNGISGFYNSTIGHLTLSGPSSVNDYQTALRSVKYENLSDNPITDARTITFVVNDGSSNSNLIARNVSIIAVNAKPILIGSIGSLNYTENDSPIVVDSNIIVFDADNNTLSNATISITNNFHATQDILSFTEQNEIAGLYEGETGVLKLTGFSSLDNYQMALRNVTYQNFFDHPMLGARMIVFMVSDGQGNSNALTRVINIIPVNDVPTVTLNDVVLNYTESSGTIAIDPTLTVVDIDHANLTEAIVSIVNNFDPEQDVLIFIDQNDIEGFYNDTSGVLSLVGASSVANYQAALRSVEYENLSEDPTASPRTISFIVDDGIQISESVTRKLNIIPVNNAPVLSNSGGALNYTENDPATIIDSSITVVDVDNPNLVSATISITNNFNFMQDVLSFTNQDGISGFYNGGTGIITLTGSASVEDYQAALRNVKYNNLSEQPMTADRTIAFIVSDGQTNSAAITRVIHIISVHDLPVITLSGSALSYTEREPAKIIDPNLNIVDLDSIELYWATVSVANNFNSAQDVLSFIDQHGITGSYNNETGILTLTGTSNIANYQIALRDIRYENLLDNPTTNPRSISFVVNDGFVSSVPAVRNITIIPINNTPTTDDGFFDFGSKLFNTILLASIGGLIGFLFLALRICLYRKATQSFEKLTSIGDVSTTEQQKKFQTNILRPIAQAIFDRIKIIGCFGYISDKRMQDYLSAVTQLIVALQQQAINVDLDNLSPASQSLLINVIAKQTENVLLPAQGCCTCGACCRCISKLYSAQVSPEEMEAQVVAIAIAIKNALKRNNYDTFLSRQSVGSGSNQGQSKVYEAPIEMAVLGSGLFAKSANAQLPTPVNRVAVEKPVFGGADAKYVPMEAPLLKSFNSNQAKDKVCAIDLVQSNMSRFGNSADPSYDVNSSQPKSPAFFQAPNSNKPQVMPVSKGLDEKQGKQNVFRM